MTRDRRRPEWLRTKTTGGMQEDDAGTTGGLLQAGQPADPAGERRPMTERIPPPPSTSPSVTTSTPIGPDVDLDADDVRPTDGTRLTQQRAAEVAEGVRHPRRPALADRWRGGIPAQCLQVDRETTVDGQRRRDSGSC